MNQFMIHKHEKLSLEVLTFSLKKKKELLGLVFEFILATSYVTRYSD